MHVKDASEQRNFTLGVPRPNAPDHDISHDFCGPMQYSGPQTTSTTARPLPAPSNTAVYGYSPYAAPFLSHAGARPSSFALSALPGVAGNQPPYPPHPAIPPPPLDTHDHGYSALSNHMANHQLYPTLSNMSHTLPASSTYHEGYPSPLDFPLNEHGLPALIGEEDRQPFSNDATPEPVSRSSSMDSAGSMDDMQLVDLQRLPQYLHRGRGVESTQHPSAVFIHRAPEVPSGDTSMRLNEQPYAPGGGASHHPPSLYSGQVPPIALADDAQPASHMQSSYAQFDGAGQQHTTAPYASTMAQYGQYNQPTIVDPERSSHHVVHLPSTFPVGANLYLQNTNSQQPMHEGPSGGHSSYESPNTVPRSLRRGLAIRQSGTVTVGNEHRYTPYGGAAQRELPPVPNAQFGSVGQHVQPNNILKPRPQTEHTVIRTGSFSGNAVPALPIASQDVIYGSTPTSGPSASIWYGNRREAAATAAGGDETKYSSTRPQNDQLLATSTIVGGTQYQPMGGPTSLQRDWQSGTRQMENVLAPTQTAAGFATRGLAVPFARFPRLEPSDSRSTANRAAASSHVPSALADGVAGVPPAALVHSFQVVPAPSAPQPLIAVQPDPKRLEHADPQRPWLVGDDGSKADRIKRFIANEAERTGHDSWPRMCPHSDCKKFLQWLDGGRAKQPVYQDEDALLRHIERCGDEVCEFCFVEGAFFGRPALAHIHRRKGCPTMEKCGGVRNIVGVYTWLEKHCTAERIEQVVASYQLGEKVRNGKPFGKYMKILHADVLRGNDAARALVDTARTALDADDIPAFAVRYSMPA
ncbi:hypothetical protein EXIGLDRAFT_745421 [Exidia glandulosa HHB12029]|uniref:Uncharacterized protein n=1 Tax=Exidia glandulosa HHB12029 TaxID=1314781 RepID=A0A165NIW2_EXIGL|nr:hypothetical protein EXIGLDRAFT_745421 [Exidia glandulosa HHB12029]